MRAILVMAAAGFLAACSFNPHGYDDPHWDVQDLFYFDPYSATATMDKADGGDVAAQLEAGDDYYWGNGVDRDSDLARSYWAMAAEQGDTVAQSRLDTVDAGQPLHYTPDGSDGRNLVTNVWADTLDKI